jgi:hypothetical protein
MITVTQNRNKGGGDVYNSIHDWTLSKSLNVLISCELGFGGQLMEVTPTRVVVQTEVMGCIDITIFEGTEEAMVMLVKTAHIANHVRHLSMSTDNINHISKNLLDFSEGSPAVIAMAAGMFIGAGIVKGTIIALLAGDDESVLPQLSAFSKDMLLTLLELHVENGVSCKDLIELAA